MAEYQRGKGPEALPYGGAAAVNRATPPAAAFQDNDVPVVFAPDTDDDEVEPDGALGENMAVLLSDPDAEYRQSVMPKDRPGRLPRYVVRHLPVLMAAAKNPDAPPTLRAYYRAIVRYLEAERG